MCCKLGSGYCGFLDLCGRCQVYMITFAMPEKKTKKQQFHFHSSAFVSINLMYYNGALSDLTTKSPSLPLLYGKETMLKDCKSVQQVCLNSMWNLKYMHKIKAASKCDIVVYRNMFSMQHVCAASLFLWRQAAVSRKADQRVSAESQKHDCFGFQVISQFKVSAVTQNKDSRLFCVGDIILFCL